MTPNDHCTRLADQGCVQLQNKGGSHGQFFIFGFKYIKGEMSEVS